MLAKETETSKEKKKNIYPNVTKKTGEYKKLKVLIVCAIRQSL
jgi:hypothetical protein